MGSRHLRCCLPVAKTVLPSFANKTASVPSDSFKMNRILAILITAVALQSAPAQLLSPESFQGAFWGAMIGGAVGADRHCGWSGDGAAIGAGVGFALGAIAGETRREQSYSTAYTYPAPTYGYRYGYEPEPVYSRPAARPNYAVGGTLVGAASGALIGEGASGKPGQGAAIGAVAGLVLGSIAEHNARRREAPPKYENPPLPAPARTVWTTPAYSPYQIPDAPHVPDAPTF